MNTKEKIDRYLINEGKQIQISYEITFDIDSDYINWDEHNKKFDDKKLKNDIKKLLRKYSISDIKFTDIEW